VENAGVKIFESCPHCGEKLSPWQQVLLSVDRSLMCKNCWYRIILDRREGLDKIDDQSIGREEE
jgi:DNA-directed RNA polymerase subunit RPC12/RpoP